MPREKKQTVDYFPHDCNHGKTITILEKRYGNDGYTFWFKLLEILGDSEGHYFDFSVDENAIYLSSQANISEEKCEEILELLQRLDAIDSELWKEEKIIWSQNFVDRLERVYQKRNGSCPEKPDSRHENKNNKGSRHENGGSRDENPTKESKVKESKVNKSTSTSIEPDGSQNSEKPESITEALDGEIKRSQLMRLIREKLSQFAEKKSHYDSFYFDTLEEIYGKFIFQMSLSDTELRWLFENYRNEIYRTALNANTENEIYAYVHQYFNERIFPEMMESRLYKNGEAEDKKTQFAEELERVL